MAKKYIDKKMHARALAEVSIILDCTQPELVKKIPEKLLRYIRENADRDYMIELSEDVELKDQNLLSETKIIMALIYRNCFCDEEEKREYDEILKKKDENNKK